MPLTVVKRTAKSVRRLEERIDELCEEMAALQRDIRGLRLEWSETYDKIHRLFGRIAKRAALDSPAPPPPLVPEVPAEPQIDEISAAILARRAAGKNL